MKYGKVTLGQVEAVWNKLGGEEGVQRFLSGELVLETGITSTSNLFNPHTYFKTRRGLWVANSFTGRILSKIGPTPHRGNEGVTSSILVRNMSDQEIIDELLGGMEETCKHSFTLDQIAAKIDLQPNGEDGELLNNGYANIFYVLVNGVPLAVSVRWHSGDREWGVSGWRLDESGRWRAGRRVFRNTTLTI